MKHHELDPWREEIRRQAYVAIQVAAAKRVATERVLAYMIRKAIGHGLSVEECCEAGDLDRAAVLELSDPAAA